MTPMTPTNFRDTESPSQTANVSRNASTRAATNFRDTESPSQTANVSRNASSRPSGGLR